MNLPPDPTRSASLEGWTFGRHDRCCAAVPLASPPEATGSRRRRLWELGSHAHCPVLGVCLPLAALRRLARKVMGGEPVGDDYELHCGMVADCKHRTRMAEAVQHDLDRRFMLPLRRAAAVKTENELATWWQEQGASKDLPGALWATLTHARCHMAQHQVGMATRVELARFEALIDDSAAPARALAATQQRNTRQAQDHAPQVEALQSELVRVREQAMAAHSVAEGLRQDLQALRDTVPQLEIRQALAQRNSQHEERMAALLRAQQQARGDIERLREQLEAANEPVEALESASTPESNAAYKPGAGNPLSDQAVLCVGGRTASMPLYRRLVEGHGARILHHDGGEEHSASQLESNLTAADLVNCQAGCVSHSAYWRVKDHCNLTGKRCVFVETPNRGALARALANVVQAP